MKWNKYPENKPLDDCFCYVTNTKRGYQTWLAFYNQRYDYFNINGAIYEGLPIEITHYIELPFPPKDSK